MKRYLFTPQQYLKAQRAWERKPSTPFAPRNESQKIWKRFAPKDASVGASELKDRHEVKRAVKRLKADEICVEEHEAVPYINTRWDEGQGEKKRRQSFLSLSRLKLTLLQTSIRDGRAIDIPLVLITLRPRCLFVTRDVQKMSHRTS